MQHKEKQQQLCSTNVEIPIDEICAAFENTIDTIITVDGSCIIQAINHPPAGWSGREVIGSDIITYVGDQYQKMVRAKIERVFATGQPESYESQDHGPNNTISWFDTRLKRFGGDASTHRVLLVIRDITRQKELEKQTRQLTKAESLCCMSGAIAHHYNNLLAVIMGNLELAVADLPTDSKHTYEIWQAMLAAKRAAKLGRMILTALGQTVCRRELLDLAEVCRQNIPHLKADLPRNITLEANLHDHVPPIMANTDQIKQILHILLTNAREAMGDCSGTIFLSIKSETSANILADHRFPVTFQPGTAGYACMTVRDEGNGIAGKDIEKIFDPFYSTKFVSRGMGLAMAQGIVCASGGCITVESALGSGSVFRVYLPLTSEAVARPPKIPAQNYAGELERKAVLVVDDEPMVREIGVRMLRFLGLDTFEAANGAEAVELFEKNHDKINCVLCDLTMPKMNGWETLAALRRIVPDIPAILASGYDRTDLLEDPVHSGKFHAFLSKPYQVADLQEALAQCRQKSILCLHAG